MQIGGKLAQLGSRPIDSMARKLAGTFFENCAGAITRGRTLMHARGAIQPHAQHDKHRNRQQDSAQTSCGFALLPSAYTSRGKPVL
jgi:hypothetical protein